MKSILLSLIFSLTLAHFCEAQIEAHKVEPFLKQYCIDCHGPKRQRGDVRLDEFSKIDSEQWQLIYEQLYHDEMPPSDELQPDKKEREFLMNYILTYGAEEDAKVAKSTGYRKLNQREYNYTLRDLLGLNNGDFNPGKLVYTDKVKKGFDTEAESLIISSDLLLEYLSAAEKSVNQSLYTEDYTKPEVESFKLPYKSIAGGGRRFTDISREHLVMRDGGAKYFSKEPRARIKKSGKYKVTVIAEPIDQFKYSGGSVFPPYKLPYLLEIGTKSGYESNAKKTYSLENKKAVYSTTMWLDKDYTFYLKFANAAGKPAANIRQALRRKKIPNGKPALPGIKISEIKLEGPFVEQWPPETYKTAFSVQEMPKLSDQKQRDKILYKFLARSYRRVPTTAEYQLYKDRLNEEYRHSSNWHKAFVKTFSAILVSPEFLYIKTGQGELNDFELASRLSYFFWSSMPDAELFEVAHSGKLKDPEVFKKQITRMYLDPKSERFMDSFVTQWLSLDKLGTMPPDKGGKFAQFFKVEKDMKRETISYFKHVLLNNRSIEEFIDSDYTFLNDRLAKFYKIPFKGGSQKMQKVAIPSNSPRGGIITHASVLTLTANGVETTPIERGHWILDELMGTPPPPPPKGTPALSPDLRKVNTVRDQLVKHRSDPNCIQCHLKMDPPGFALEAFDPIGRFRKTYENKLEIDTAGLFLGSKFTNSDGLKKVLLSNSQIVARNLMIKLAEYAKGRKLNLKDLKTIDLLVRKSAKKNYAFRSMLGDMLQSDLIREH